MAGASYKPLPKFDERTIATSEKTFHLLRRMSKANHRKAKLQCDELNRGPPKKPDTLKFKEMFSFLIGLQATKARLLCCKCDL